MAETAAVILTHNRPELLARCVAAIERQVDNVLIIDNASDPPVDTYPVAEISVVRIDTQPPNIAQMWNRGLDMLTWMPGLPRRVAFLCDDAIVPEGWFAAVSRAMDEHGAAAGASSPHAGGQTDVQRAPFSGSIMNRMPGWAFVLDNTKGIRADPTMHWWWVDTDIDYQARAAGGMVLIGTHPVPNERPGEYTATKPELGERAGHDRWAFAQKWGSNPW